MSTRDVFIPSIAGSNMTAVVDGHWYTYEPEYPPPGSPPPSLLDPYRNYDMDNIWQPWQLSYDYLYLALVPPRSIGCTYMAFQSIGYAAEKLPLTSDITGYFLRPEVVSLWDELIVSLNDYIAGMKAITRNCTPSMKRWPEPSQYGYRLIYPNIHAARAAASASQDAFYPLIALATFYTGAVLYMKRFSPSNSFVDWHHNVAYENAIHPSAGNLLEACLRDPHIQRVGGYIDAREVREERLASIEIVTQFNTALYTQWGSINNAFLPMTRPSWKEESGSCRITMATIEYLMPIVLDLSAPLRNARLIGPVPPQSHMPTASDTAHEHVHATAVFTKFFAQRDQHNEQIRLTETPRDRQARESRQACWASSTRPPGKKGPSVFHWIKDDRDVYIRVRLDRALVEHEWGEYTGIQRHYDPFRNQFDLSHLFDPTAKGDNKQFEELEEELYGISSPHSLSYASETDDGIPPSISLDDIVMSDPLPGMLAQAQLPLPMQLTPPSTETLSCNGDSSPRVKDASVNEDPHGIDDGRDISMPQPYHRPRKSVDLVPSPEDTLMLESLPIIVGVHQAPASTQLPPPHSSETTIVDVDLPSPAQDAEDNASDGPNARRDGPNSHPPSPPRPTTRDHPTTAPTSNNRTRVAWLELMYPPTVFDVVPIRSTTFPADSAVIKEVFQRYGFINVPLLEAYSIKDLHFTMKTMGYFNCQWQDFSDRDALDRIGYMFDHASQRLDLQCDLDQSTSAISRNIEYDIAVNYQKVYFEDDTSNPLWMIPSSNGGPHLIIPNADTMVMVLRNKLGTDPPTIAKALYDKLAPFFWVRDIPPAPNNYKPTGADWQEYVDEVAWFAQGDRGFAAGCAGGVIARIVHEHVTVQNIIWGPLETEWLGMHRHLCHGASVRCVGDLSITSSEADLITADQGHPAFVSFFPRVDLWPKCTPANLTWTAQAEDWYLTRMRKNISGDLDVCGTQAWLKLWRDSKHRVRDTLKSFEKKARQWLELREQVVNANARRQDLTTPETQPLLDVDLRPEVWSFAAVVLLPLHVWFEVMREPCTKCGSILEATRGTIISCKQCNRNFHHKCHDPPLSTVQLITVLKAYVAHSSPHFEWTCAVCAKTAPIVVDESPQKLQRKRLRRYKEVWPVKKTWSGRPEEIILLSDDEGDAASISTSANTMAIDTATKRIEEISLLSEDDESPAPRTPTRVPSPINISPDTSEEKPTRRRLSLSSSSSIQVVSTPFAQPHPTSTSYSTPQADNAMDIDQESASELKVKKEGVEPALPKPKFDVPANWLEPLPPPRSVHLSRRPGKVPIKKRLILEPIYMCTADWTTEPPRL
ncbi:hypothetical protein BDZ89DRAFT_1144758 [Hymenopellis radicata]|nr:hypothetical protein BDZ89DRAFT_1144758 [Hymenopellis radicata]